MYLYIVINFYKIFSTILNFKLYSFEDTFIYIYIYWKKINIMDHK